jgi:hypothetical protein
VVRARVEEDHRFVFGVDAWFHRARIIFENPKKIRDRPRFSAGL